MGIDDFKIRQEVSFKPGPRAAGNVTAKITGKSDCGNFLITKDADGKVRKVRPGACTRV